MKRKQYVWMPMDVDSGVLDIDVLSLSERQCFDSCRSYQIPVKVLLTPVIKSKKKRGGKK